MNRVVEYLNTEGPNCKRIIVPDPETAPIVIELYVRFETGRYSIKQLASPN
jgi:hypothetical protein